MKLNCFKGTSTMNNDKCEHEKNGYQVECIHSGQKRRYGDTFREFKIKTDRSREDVEKYCTEHVYKCSLHYDDWLAKERSDDSSMESHFRSSYKFRRTSEGEYFYQVIQPSTH